MPTNSADPEDQSLLRAVHVQKFRGLLDTKVKLTRLHAIVGPNDSGKSLLLRAIRTGFNPLRGAKAEERAIRALALMASEGTLDVVVFSRDADNDPTRHDVIERTLSELAQATPARVPMAGAVATPCLEGWLLALGGVTKTEAMTRSKSEALLAERGVAPKDTAAMVEFVRGHGFTDAAADARSLQHWKDRVSDALSKQQRPADEAAPPGLRTDRPVSPALRRRNRRRVPWTEKHGGQRSQGYSARISGVRGTMRPFPRDRPRPNGTVRGFDAALPGPISNPAMVRPPRNSSQGNPPTVLRAPASTSGNPRTVRR